MKNDETMPELKPCPFCKPNDSEPSMRTGSDFTKPNYSVYCKCCHVSTPLFANENIARERWNTRADRPEPELAEVRDFVRMVAHRGYDQTHDQDKANRAAAILDRKIGGA